MKFRVDATLKSSFNG